MTEQQRAIHNERVKLRAAMLNNIGTALIVTGLVAPMVNVAYSGRVPDRPLGP